MNTQNDVIIQQTENNDQIKINNKNVQKRTEIEKELNIQRNPKNKGQIPNISEMEMNHLNYYNEIAKHNVQGKMNNPTFKEIYRITKDESCLEQLKAKKNSKDLPQILDNMPLKRVERITYKSKEIGQMRKALGKYCQKNPFVYINKEMGTKFASNVFTKRLKKENTKTDHSSTITIDNLYGRKKMPTNKSSKIFNNSTNNESWVKKYKTNTHISSNSNRIQNFNGTQESKTEIIISDYNNRIRDRKTIDKPENDLIKAINNTEINLINNNFNEKNKKEMNRNNKNKDISLHHKMNTNIVPNRKNLMIKNINEDFNQNNKDINKNEKNTKTSHFSNRSKYSSSNLNQNNTVTNGKNEVGRISVNKAVGNYNEKKMNGNKTYTKVMSKRNEKIKA